MLAREACQAGLDDFEILDEAHFALVVGQRTELAPGEAGNAGRKRLDHVTEALKSHAGLVDGAAIGQVNGTAAFNGRGEGRLRCAQDGGGQLDLGPGIAGVGAEVGGQRGDPLLKLASLKALHLFGGGLDELAFAASQPAVEVKKHGKAGHVLAHEDALYLSIAQVAQSHEPAFEDSAGFWKGRAGEQALEQDELRDQPPGGDAQFVDCMFRELGLATFELMAIGLPEILQRASQAKSDGDVSELGSEGLVTGKAKWLASGLRVWEEM